MRRANHPDAPVTVEPEPAHPPRKNHLRRSALVAVLIALLLFALSVARERPPPLSRRPSSRPM